MRPFPSYALLLPLVALLLLFAKGTKAEDCQKQFRPCDVPEDCCGNLQCFILEPADPTAKQCLTETSMELQSLPRLTKLNMLKRFYQGDHVPKDKRRSAKEVEAMFNKQGKYFAKIMTTLENAFPQVKLDKNGMPARNEF